jgi:hypothetical protein
MKNILKFVFMAIFGIIMFNMPTKASAATCSVGCLPDYVVTSTHSSGTILQSTNHINIPANGSNVTINIATPPQATQQILGDISRSNNPVYAYLTTNGSQGCGCSSYGKITAYDGANQITFQSISTTSAGRGTNDVYLQLLGPFNVQPYTAGSNLTLSPGNVFDLSLTPHISSATVDNLIQLGTVGGNRNQAYGLGSSGSGGHTYFLACASGGTDGSICQDDGIYGDILAITDSSSNPYLTINSNHDIGISGNFHAPGAQFTNLGASSSVCTDASKNLTTAGCIGGSGGGVASVSAASSNIAIAGSSTNPTVDLGSSPTVSGTFTAQTFASSTSSQNTVSGLDGPILHPTSQISIPSVGNSVTWTIFQPPYGVQEYLNTVNDSDGGPIYVHITSSGNEGCNCASYGEITGYNGSNQITFKSLTTNNGGRGAGVYIHLLGPVSIGGTPIVSGIASLTAGSSNLVIGGTTSAPTVDLASSISLNGTIVADANNSSSYGFYVGNGTAGNHPQAFAATLGMVRTQ